MDYEQLGQTVCTTRRRTNAIKVAKDPEKSKNFTIGFNTHSFMFKFRAN